MNFKSLSISSPSFALNNTNPSLVRIVSISLILVALIVLLVSMGSSPTSYLDPRSFLLVAGGTFLAASIHFSFRDLIDAYGELKRSLNVQSEKTSEQIEIIIQAAQIFRVQGPVALEKFIQNSNNPFMQRALELVVDARNAEDIERILNIESSAELSRAKRAAEVLSVMGEYAPALGLIGTILGLVQMMGNLGNQALVGPGMALALITTLYGACLANLVFLPCSGRIRNSIQQQQLNHQLVIEGTIGISRKENPVMLEQRLLSFM